MNRYRIVTAFVLASAFLAAQGQQTPDPLVVTTFSGQIRGVTRTGGGAEFRGIPFAEPPVGNLRWHEPIPAKAWTGVRDATQFGSPCAQPDLGAWNHHDAETGKEDCLSLNVVTSVWPVQQKPLPVMLWLHGGANAGGSSSNTFYNGGTLVQHGVVLVTVNYRLSVFGFLAHPGLTHESAHASSGNYGLQDQILALRWVRQNIARFGGDPNNITIFGQSAGAIDTSLLMTSFAKNEFHKAIAESGAAFLAPVPPLAQAENTGTAFATAMGAPAAGDAVKFLRALSAEDLLKAVMDPDPRRHPHVGPIVDGWVIPESPAKVFAAGQQSQIPMLLGVTTREFGNDLTAAQLTLHIRFIAGSHAEEALKLYPLSDNASDPLYGKPADQWAADMVFHCPVSTEAAWQNKAQQPVYLYQFDHPIPGQEALGAVHSAELPYVFGNFPKSGNISGKFTEVDAHLSDLMQTYWTNFAKTGNPNAKDVPNWPRLTEAGGYLEFLLDGRPEARNAELRGAQCALYREILDGFLHEAQ